MPPPVEERRFVSFDGTAIAYQAVGQGRPILLCNGLGGGWEAWSHQISSFRDRYRLLCWDYRGLYALSLIHISEPTRPFTLSRMPSSA